MFLAFSVLKKDTNKKKKFISLLSNMLDKNINDPVALNELLKLEIIDTDMANYLKQEPNVEKFFEANPTFAEFKEYLLNDFPREENLRRLELLLVQKQEFERGIPNIMSIHKSKGLSSDYVFILGLVNGIFPRDSQGIDTIEAERRLLYVGMTRTKKGLHLISTIEWNAQIVHKFDSSKFGYKGRKIRTAQTSPFISELKIMK